MNYTDLLDMWNKGKSQKHERGIPLSGRSTRLYMNTNKSFSIRYHATDVVKVFPNNVYELNSGGYRTKTTKERISVYSPISITQHQYNWYIINRAYNLNTPYFDGIRINARGKVLNPKPSKSVKKDKAKRIKLRNKIKNYINGFIAYIEENKGIELPNGGDCLYCVLHTKYGESLGDSIKDVEHLLSHIEEKYYVPALLWNSLKEHGYNPQYVFPIKHKMSPFYNDHAIKRALMAYFKKRFEAMLKSVK